MKYRFMLVFMIALASPLSGCFSPGYDKAEEGTKVPSALQEAARPFLDFTDKKVNANNITDAAGNTVWSLIKPSGSEIKLTGGRGLLFSKQAGPAYAGLRTNGNLTEVFEASFQVDRMGHCRVQW